MDQHYNTSSQQNLVYNLRKYMLQKKVIQTPINTSKDLLSAQPKDTNMIEHRKQEGSIILASDEVHTFKSPSNDSLHINESHHPRIKRTRNTSLVLLSKQGNVAGSSVIPPFLVVS